MGEGKQIHRANNEKKVACSCSGVGAELCCWETE
jgi:hypothetical protein